METKKSFLERLDEALEEGLEAGLHPVTIKIGPKKVMKSLRGLSKEEIAKAHLNSHILGNNLYMSLSSWTMRNNNIMVFGGSGTGKSRFVVKPNVLNYNGSYVITDPSGELLSTLGKALERQGYNIKVLNVNDTSCSNRYNPFAYVRDIPDIPVFVNSIISNLGGKSGGSNQFWDDAVTNILNALFAYLFEAYPMEQRTFANATKLLRMMDMDKAAKDKSYVSPLDLLFEDWNKKTGGRSFAYSQYTTFKQSMGETQSNILISAGVKISTIFDVEGLNNLTARDELELDKVGKEKTALFLIIPVGDTTYNFLTSLLITQLFRILYKIGDSKLKAGKSSPALDVHVDIILDEIANIGVIPNLDLYMSTVRKYNIGIIPIWQAVSQMKDNKAYKDMADTLIGNCDTMIYLGGSDEKTTKYVSELLGKMSIKSHTSNINKKAEDIHVAKKARETMTPDELARLDNDECIVCFRGEHPFKVKKYDLTAHPNYSQSGDADELHNSLPLTRFDMTVRTDKSDSFEYIFYKINPKTGRFYVKKNAEGKKQRIPVATLAEWNEAYKIQPPDFDRDENGNLLNMNGYVIKVVGKRMTVVDAAGEEIDGEDAKPYCSYKFPDPESDSFGGAWTNKHVSLIDIFGTESEFSLKKKKQSEEKKEEPVKEENEKSKVVSSKQEKQLSSDEIEDQRILSDEMIADNKGKISAATTEHDEILKLAELKGMEVLNQFDPEFDVVIENRLSDGFFESSWEDFDLEKPETDKQYMFTDV